ncbi:MAG: hypothetical protein Q9184_006826, partial [Pyrenodesmia sp. 2 TL-2023]
MLGRTHHQFSLNNYFEYLPGIFLLFAPVLANQSYPASEVSFGQARTNTSTIEPSCRCFPGDACWPKSSEWEEFNKTLNGKLVATRPIASACHDDPFAIYNPQACRKLQSTWFTEETHYESSSSVMAPFFANQSCDPFSARDARCVLGTYIQYAVNASDASDFQAAIKFVQRYNIRLTIRNTGHDYNGKSTGAGAVGIWTHHMKNIEILDYKSLNYSGKAMKMGAGVQGYEAYRAAHGQGLLVVGGNCPTVGLAGGYTQGGGHGPLASKFGLAADQVLEWEVVTAMGTLLRATPIENSDLFWALCGGGGGTFGVVVSMTTKLYEELPSSASTLNFTKQGASQEVFYDVVGTFHETLIPLVDAGGVSVWQFTNDSFSMAPAYGPGISGPRMRSLLDPVIKKLHHHSMNYTFAVKEFPSFLDSYDAMNPPIPTAQIQIGGRFIPRSLVLKNNSVLTDAFRTINNRGGGAAGLALNVSNGITPRTAVHPLWRDALFNIVLYTQYNYQDWEANIANQQLMTQELIPQLSRLTPGGGAYLSEADFLQPDFQNTLYGRNYQRLKAVKNKYDPL